MKKYDELTARLLERRDQYVAVQTAKRKRIMQVALPMSGGLLAAVIGIALWQGGVFENTPPVTDNIQPDTAVSTTENTTADTTEDATVPTTTVPTDIIPTVNHSTTVDDGTTADKTTSATGKPHSTTTTEQPTTGKTDPTTGTIGKPTKNTTTGKAKPSKPPVVTVGRTTKTTTQTTNTTKRKNNVLWSDDCGGIGNEGAVLFKHGKYMKYHMCLHSIVQSAHPNDKIAVLAEPVINMNFVYKGKTMEEYRKEYRKELAIKENLHTLLLYGDLLKYGEALYTTGTPDGTRWAESYYKSTIDTIGEDLLSKYIVNGEFLKEKAQSAYDNFQYKTDYSKIRNDCNSHIKTELKGLLDRLEIDYYTLSLGIECIVFNATTEELEKLSNCELYELNGFHFHWASRSFCVDE